MQYKLHVLLSKPCTKPLPTWHCNSNNTRGRHASRRIAASTTAYLPFQASTLSSASNSRQCCKASTNTEILQHFRYLHEKLLAYLGTLTVSQGAWLVGRLHLVEGITAAARPPLLLPLHNTALPGQVCSWTHKDALMTCAPEWLSV